MQYINKSLLKSSDLSALFNLSLPIEKEIDKLIEKYHSDKRAKLIFTQGLFKIFILLIFLLDRKLASLRGISEFSSNLLFQAVTHLKPYSKSGLSDALRRIPYQLFEELFLKLIGCCKNKSKSSYVVFDSTLFILSLKLFPWLGKINQSQKGALKLTIRIDKGQTLPQKVVISKKGCENTVFKLILDLNQQGLTYIFDRGYYTIRVFDQITDSHNFFITRKYPYYKVTILKNRPIPKRKKEGSIILKDQIVKIGSENKKGKNKKTLSKNKFRLIITKTEKGEILEFLTNRFDLKAIEVCELYKHRWEIEILFRWLKQYLRINRFISYSENGVLIQVYIALIVQLLLLWYQGDKRLKELSLLKLLRRLNNELINGFGFLMFKQGLRQGLFIQGILNFLDNP